MKNFDIKNRVQILTPKAFTDLGKLSYFKEGDEFLRDFAEEADEEASTINYSYVAYIEGDMTLEGNVVLDDLFKAIKNTCVDQMQTEDDYVFLIWITGNLSISGTLRNKERTHYCDALVVEKNTTIKNILFGGTNLYFLEGLTVTQIFFTIWGSEGWLSIKGKEDIYIDVDNNDIWTKAGQYYHFADGLTPEQIDQIFVSRFDFLEQEKELFYLEEDAFVKALMEGTQLFK